jgi:hypothetical protein
LHPARNRDPHAASARDARWRVAPSEAHAAWPRVSPALPHSLTRAGGAQAPDAGAAEAKKQARGARFGGAEGGAGDAEVVAKLEARAARFGSIAAAAASAPVDPEFEAKKKARAERFGTGAVPAAQ